MDIEHVLSNREVDLFLKNIKEEYEKAKDTNKPTAVILSVEMIQQLYFCLLELQGFRKLSQVRIHEYKFRDHFFLLTELEELEAFKLYESVSTYLLSDEEMIFHKYLIQQKHIQEYLKSLYL